MSAVSRLHKAKAFAWAKYYEAKEEAHNNNVAHYNTTNAVIEIHELPKHLVDEYKVLLVELHKTIECPICFEIIDKLRITGCGHKYCNDCFDKINECAVCRRKIKKR
tara:strand:- start:1265 stop:1585 length:321 start_codon:yes stop_codon:yes gene_type:complete